VKTIRAQIEARLGIDAQDIYGLSEVLGPGVAWGVNVFPSQIEELVLATPTLAPHFRIELIKSGHLDVMTVVVEATAEVDSQTVETAVDQLTLRIKTQTGITARVEAVPCGSIERSTGKARRVIDERSAP